MPRPTVGIIGGSGIYDLEGLSQIEEVVVETPFGSPSGVFVTGQLGGRTLAFLARHGAAHDIPPHQINYRANIWALKKLGVEWIISMSAVGSMREEIRPGDMVVVDQFIDRTWGRESTFFQDGIAAHVSMAAPVSAELADVLGRAASEVLGNEREGAKVHRGGTYLVMNGPQFSSRAESLLYRQWGVSVIGMTNLPEAKLAREAEISYATVALATDFDCWHESEEDVTVDAVVAIMKQNAVNARNVAARAVELLPETRTCSAKNALQFAIMTKPESVSAEVRERLDPIVGKYFR